MARHKDDDGGETLVSHQVRVGCTRVSSCAMEPKNILNTTKNVRKSSHAGGKGEHTFL